MAERPILIDTPARKRCLGILTRYGIVPESSQWIKIRLFSSAARRWSAVGNGSAGLPLEGDGCRAVQAIQSRRARTFFPPGHMLEITRAAAKFSRNPTSSGAMAAAVGYNAFFQLADPAWPTQAEPRGRCRRVTWSFRSDRPHRWNKRVASTVAGGPARTFTIPFKRRRRSRLWRKATG